jgi:hypothetical protein
LIFSTLLLLAVEAVEAELGTLVLVVEVLVVTDRT